MAIRKDINAPEVKTKTNPPTGDTATGEESQMVKDMLAVRRQRAVEAMIKSEYAEKPKNEEGSSIQATIVNKAIEQGENAYKALERLTDKKDAEIEKARSETNKAKEELYSLQAAQLKEVAARVEKAMEELKAGGSPKTAIEVIHEAEVVADYINQHNIAKNGQTVVRSGEVSEETKITLEKMRMDHELALKQIDLQIAELNNKFNLELAEFKENSRRHWAEYENNNRFRQEGMQGLGDVVASIAAGINQERQGEVGSQPTRIRANRAKAQPARETAPEEYECENCQTLIQVPPGASSFRCPECDTEYNVSVEEPA